MEGTGVPERDDARVTLDSDRARMKIFGGNSVVTMLILSVEEEREVLEREVLGESMLVTVL